MTFISKKNLTILLVVVFCFTVTLVNNYGIPIIISTLFISFFSIKYLVALINYLWEDYLIEIYSNTMTLALETGNLYNFELILKRVSGYNTKNLLFRIVSIETKQESRVALLKILFKYDENISTIIKNKNIFDHMDQYDHETFKFIIQYSKLDKEIIKEKYRKLCERISNFDKSFNDSFLECFKLAIEKGFDEQFLTENKENLLILVCKKIIKLDFFDYVLELVPNLNMKDKFGFTALHYACLTNNINYVRKLIEKKCDLNVYDVNNLTVLDWLEKYSNFNNYEITQLLLNNKAKRFSDL